MSYPPPPSDQPGGQPGDQAGAPPPPPSPPPPPAYGAPPPPGQYYGGGGYAVPVGNQKALWAMILGIVGLVCCTFASIAAIVLGLQAKKEIEASGGMQTGAGQAQAGFVMGIIGCALGAIGIIAYIGLVAVGSTT
jgi:hypothetical protein